MPSRPPRTTARDRLLEAATDSIRCKGFAATSVDELVAQVGVTKGAFFHHFKSKEALGIAVAQRWGEIGKQITDLVGGATPRDRVLNYLDLRSQMIEGSTDEFSCLAGTLAQEVHISHPAIRDAAAHAIETTAATLEPDLADALKAAGRNDISPASLALHIQAGLQGAYVVAKAKSDAGTARESVAHLKRYVAMLLGVPTTI
jgi:TetR/AcrR family transcriptional repressor of nem operon